MTDNALTKGINDILLKLTDNQSVTSYLAQHPGFNQYAPVPSHDTLQGAMRNLVEASHRHTWPEGGKLTHLDDIAGAIGWLSAETRDQFKGESAKLFNDAFINNPKCLPLAREMEFALTALEKQSPETWTHIQNHTALTMLYFERQCMAEDKVTGAKPGTAFHDPEHQEQALLLILGALGHDIGKVAIAPELLHKATRINPERLKTAMDEYKKNVPAHPENGPAYPEKEHDIAFMNSANEGKYIFAGHRDKIHFPDATLILNVGADYTRGELALTDEQQRQKHSAIWERINQKAEEAKLTHWLTPEEQRAVTSPKRGTVTDHEMAVIATHDEMSEEFFKAATVPPKFKAVRHIVSMERFRQGKGATPTLTDEEMKLTQIIHATDMLEALLAPRSYRGEGIPAAEAVKIMKADAKGALNNDIVDHIVRNGTLALYQPRTPAIPESFAALTADHAVSLPMGASLQATTGAAR